MTSEKKGNQLSKDNCYFIEHENTNNDN